MTQYAKDNLPSSITIGTIVRFRFPSWKAETPDVAGLVLGFRYFPNAGHYKTHLVVLANWELWENYGDIAEGNMPVEWVTKVLAVEIMNKGWQAVMNAEFPEVVARNAWQWIFRIQEAQHFRYPSDEEYGV